jgi:hypothetical protein
MVFFAAALNGAAGEEIPRRKGEGEMAFHLGSSIAGGCGGMYALLQVETSLVWEGGAWILWNLRRKRLCCC